MNRIVGTLLVLATAISCRHAPPATTPAQHVMEFSPDPTRLMYVWAITEALKLFYSDNGRYPMPATASTTGPTPTDGTPSWSTFMPKWPQALLPPGGTCTSAQNDYVYTQLNGGASYILTFCLGLATGGYTGGVHTATPFGIQ